MTTFFGIGYQEYRNKRVLNEGLRSSDIERAGYEKFILYFGRAHVVDHETGTLARGPLKIGRGKFATALMRGRNQPGIDFRIYAEIVVDSNDATTAAEEIAKSLFKSAHKTMPQNQQECYDISDSEIQDSVDKVVEKLKNTHHNVLEVNVFQLD